MFAAVNETAKTISPLSMAISNGIMRSINFTIAVMMAPPRVSRQKKIQHLAHALKLEYPYESKDYVMYMASEMYKD
jgi:hypothetical protein